MKKLQKEFEFSTEQTKEVAALARALGITETVAGICYARGMTDERKLREFLYPSRERLLPPFLMKGMREAVELIKQARDEEWRVAVFGDYDADGIGACAILSRALAEFGIQPYLYVPERTDGYGMSVAAIDRIFDEFMPDLFITVDCGISNRKEVEYIKEQGSYVIVTDHHELPEELPDCITINPKLKDDYPYDNLCGAGVAFKLAVALIGERAYSLLDFCALSTVADSVPLKDENRIIVAEGLKMIAENPRPAFAALLGKTTEITSQTLSFSVAPRVNAAGRMGDARAALDLFTTDDPEEIQTLSEKLNAYNLKRQRECDELYRQAADAVRREGAYGNVIMLAGDKWHAGFLGIVAARIAEEFARPALLFVKSGGMLRGSARSIENINIYEALRACSEHIEEFGGHAQAAGINVREEEFGALKQALNDYIGTHYGESDFIPTITVTGNQENAERVARELALLEPFGIGNPRPLFTLDCDHVAAACVKPESPHVTFTEGGMSFMYFSGSRDLKPLRSDLHKTLVFEYNLSHFRGREYLKGFVRAVLCNGVSGTDVVYDAFENLLGSLRGGENATVEQMTAGELDGFIGEARKNCRYGLCAVVFDRATLGKYRNLGGLDVEAFRVTSGSAENTVLYAPDPDVDLTAFREVVFLDRPAAYSYRTGKARLIASDLCGYGDLFGLDIAREPLLEIYAAIRNSRAPVLGEAGKLAALGEGCRYLGFEPREFLFALAVFGELGLVRFDGGRLNAVRGMKVGLTDSIIYSRVGRILETE